LSAVRVTKAADVTVPASEVGQLDRLEGQLKQLLAAVERRKHAALTKAPAPRFPAGRDPLKLVPDMTSLIFKLFYREPAPAGEVE
jgi:hypothetical protein